MRTKSIILAVPVLLLAAAAASAVGAGSVRESSAEDATATPDTGTGQELIATGGYHFTIPADFNGGIFGTPPANIPTNIFTLNSSSKNKALGFFAVSSVSKFETIIDKNKAKPKQ